MRNQAGLGLVLLIVLAWLGGWMINWQRATAAPTVLAESLQGGCYLDTHITCKIHVEPFQIIIAPFQTLLGFHIKANNQIIYDFGASTNFAPSGSYTPSSVALDFAASCGKTYTLKLEALDTGDLEYINIGQTAAFKCPPPVIKFLPLIIR